MAFHLGESLKGLTRKAKPDPSRLTMRVCMLGARSVDAFLIEIAALGQKRLDGVQGCRVLFGRGRV